MKGIATMQSLYAQDESSHDIEKRQLLRGSFIAKIQ